MIIMGSKKKNDSNLGFRALVDEKIQIVKLIKIKKY